MTARNRLCTGQHKEKGFQAGACQGRCALREMESAWILFRNKKEAVWLELEDSGG